MNSTLGAPVFADRMLVDDLSINAGDTAMMFVATAFVQLMTPGLAFFYGGLVRHSTVLTMMMQSLSALGVVFTVWYAVAFSMAFGESFTFVGNPFTFAFFRNMNVEEPLVRNGLVVVPGIPGLLFAAYQGMFAVISPALITGAFADRLRWQPYVLFIALWTVLVYAPVAHWVWGGGWMMNWGVWDFAGGIVVHTTSGFSSLATLFVLGKRPTPEHGEHALFTPHNVPHVILGTALLWFGWFGFNGGSALQANGVAVLAAVNSQIAGSVALMVWLFVGMLLEGSRPSVVGACVGAVAGLATVTPAAGYVPTWAAGVIGILAGVICYSCVLLVQKMDFDDALDVLGVHGIGGVIGSIMVGVLADGEECRDAASAPASCVNPGTAIRSVQQAWIQFACAAITAVYSIVTTIAILKFLGAFMKLSPSEKDQERLDAVMHGETAYVDNSRGSLEAVLKIKDLREESDNDSEEDTSRAPSNASLSARGYVPAQAIYAERI